MRVLIDIVRNGFEAAYHCHDGVACVVSAATTIEGPTNHGRRSYRFIAIEIFEIRCIFAHPLFVEPAVFESEFVAKNALPDGLNSTFESRRVSPLVFFGERLVSRKPPLGHGHGQCNTLFQ